MPDHPPPDASSIRDIDRDIDRDIEIRDGIHTLFNYEEQSIFLMEGKS